MGFQLARDNLAHCEGKRSTIRELCGKCVLKAEYNPGWFERLELGTR